MGSGLSNKARVVSSPRSKLPSRAYSDPGMKFSMMRPRSWASRSARDWIARTQFTARISSSELSARITPRLPDKRRAFTTTGNFNSRSEEHTSELQSRLHLVCRLLLEKKKSKHQPNVAAGQSPYNIAIHHV